MHCIDFTHVNVEAAKSPLHVCMSLSFNHNLINSSGIEVHQCTQRIRAQFTSIHGAYRTPRCLKGLNIVFTLQIILAKCLIIREIFCV